MATVATTAPPKPGSESNFRSNYFNVIGIESKMGTVDPLQQQSALSQTPSVVSPPAVEQHVHMMNTNNWVNPRSQKVTIYTDSLKYDKLADEKFSTKRRKTEEESKNEEDQTENTKAGKNRRNRRLNFNETVEVVPIPMRTEYSNRVRTRLWSSAMEIHENAARNTVEFAAEG